MIHEIYMSETKWDANRAYERFIEVYGDKYAMILWGPPVKIVLIENEAIAESFRRQFYAHWNRGKFSVVKKK